jgi:outer membrane receptor protein involved in Fe transport
MKFSFGILFILITICSIRTNGQDSSANQLNTVVVSANKISEKRITAPIAMSVISSKTINALKSNRIDYLLNTVSGVYMPTIGNEQHMMSIRQPISLKGLYLYLEDGMPIRTSGLFSNNALIEINSSNIQSIEIIKGPASALYGAEAIGGVVNIISQQAPNQKLLNFSNQINSLGLIKSDVNFGFPSKKGGWLINANYGAQNNGPIDYSDFSKKSVSLRHDFNNNKFKGYQTINYINYFAQMTGSVDSIHFVSRDFNSLQTFTYRKLSAFRFRQNLSYQWNNSNTTIFNFMYRDNAMDQNPTYSIGSTSNPTSFKGQTNRNVFNAFVFDIQHLIKIESLHSKLIIGFLGDQTQQNLKANFINIYKDTIIGKYTKFSYPANDSLLTNYQTKINNQAIYLNFISKIGKHFNSNLALRYDQFEYLFQNKLTSGTPSSNNNFSSVTPKLGITYNNKQFGAYLNYSKGFVPPQITEIYNAIRVPYLLPQTFNNQELGGWLKHKNWFYEISIYQLNGQNEIISVRQPDGVNLNQNSGSTQHTGIEYQIQYQPINILSFNWNGTYAKHKYTQTIIKGTDVSGKEMNAAPNFWSNLNSTLKLNQNVNALLEWQHQSAYFMDETNATKYPGFDVLNVRINLKHKKMEYWLHILNATNTYYSTMATKNFSVKGNAAYSYYIGEPRSIAIGCKWSL